MKKNKSSKKYQDVVLFDTGLTFRESDVKTEGLGGKNHPLLAALMQFIMSALLSFGAIFTFIGMFEINCSNIAVGVVMAIFSILFLAVFYFPKKVKRIILLSFAGIVVILCAVFHSILWDGVLNIKDFVVDGVYDAMFWTKNSTVDLMALDSFPTTFVLCILGAVLTLGVAFFNSTRVRFFWLFLITFPFFEIGAAFGVVPPYIAFAILLAGWTSTFSVFAASFVKKRREKGRQKRQKRKENGDQYKRRNSLVSGIGVLMAVVTVAVFLFTNMFLSSEGYTREGAMLTLRENITETVANIYDLITGEDRDGSLKEGQLYKLGDRKVKNRHYMTIEMYGNEPNMYFRGYVGQKYTGRSWESFDDIDEYQVMFDNFYNNELYPQQFTGELLNDLLEAGTDPELAATAKEIKLSSFRRKKDYAYVLANTYFGDSFNYNLDTSIVPPSRSSYSYTTFMNSTNYYKVTSAPMWLDSTFQALKTQYSTFVKNEYLQLPANYEYLRDMLGTITMDAGDNMEIADYIRYYLQEITTKSDKVPTLPEGKDFVEYFLLESKTGYSAHYATAATLLLRAAGVPARYVEGYLLSDKTWENNLPDEDGKYTVNVTDNEAHAWVEIYFDNYGWMPVEVTPGFYSGHLSLEGFEVETVDPGDSDTIIVDEDSDIIIAIPPVPDTDEQPEIPATPWQQFLQWLGKILPRVINVALQALINIAILLLLILIVLLIRWGFARLGRKIAFTMDSPNKRVINLYKYYCKLLEFEGIKRDGGVAYLEFAKIIGERSGSLSQEESLRAMNLFLKSAFSVDPLEESESDEAFAIVDGYRQKLYKSLKLTRKISFILFKNLA